MTQTSTPQPGQTITGTDVTWGCERTAPVVEIWEPVFGTGDSSPRYRLLGGHVVIWNGVLPTT